MARLFVAITVISLAGASVARGAAMAPEVGQTSAGASTCVGVVLPSVQGVDGNAADVASTVRELFTARLTGPSLQAMSLDARLPSQALEEARQKQCEHVLIATLTRKRDGGGNVLGKMLGGAGNAAAWNIPGGSSTISDVARGTVMAGVQAVTTTLASSTRAKDELWLECSRPRTGRHSWCRRQRRRKPRRMASICSRRSWTEPRRRLRLR